MWNGKRLPIIGSMALIMWASSTTAQPASGPTARQAELAHRYIVAAHMDRTMDGTMKSMIPAMLANMPTDASVTPEKKQVIVEAVTDVTRGMMAKIMARMEPIMAETYSETELEAMVAFYESPVGQSMLAKTPQMMAKFAPVMQDVMPEMQKEMKAKLCERKIGC